MFADKQSKSDHWALVGQIGEDIAVSYLRESGWSGFRRNVRIGGCELDIVGRDPDGLLVAVEVKFSERGLPGYSGEVRLNRRKIAALRRGLQMFADKHPGEVARGLRLDAVCITPKSEDLTINTKDYEINHYINILA